MSLSYESLADLTVQEAYDLAVLSRLFHGVFDGALLHRNPSKPTLHLICESCEKPGTIKLCWRSTSTRRNVICCEKCNHLLETLLLCASASGIPETAFAVWVKKLTVALYASHVGVLENIPSIRGHCALCPTFVKASHLLYFGGLTASTCADHASSILPLYDAHEKSLVISHDHAVQSACILDLNGLLPKELVMIIIHLAVILIRRHCRAEVLRQFVI